MIKLLLIAHIFLLSAFVFAQSGVVTQHYTSENGLPANGIQSLELDTETGFLWIGTQAGLVRFDGRSFKNFFASNENPTSFRIGMLAKNRQGTIFSEDDHYAVYRISNNRPQFEMTDSVFIPSTGLPPGGFRRGTAMRVVEMLKRHQPAQFLPEFIEFDPAAANDTNYAFIYFGRGYYYSSRDERLCSISGCNSLLRIGAKIYYVCANNLFAFNQLTGRFEPVPIQASAVNASLRTELRFLWKRGMEFPLVIHGTDLYKLEAVGPAIRLEPLCLQCVPQNAEINSAQVWPGEETIFLGSPVSGLYVIRNRHMQTMIDLPAAKGSRYEYGQAEVKPGVVNTSSGAVFTTEGVWLRQKPKLSFTEKNIFKSSDGDFWFSSADTIIHHHPSSGKYTRIPTGDGAFRFVFAESGTRVFVFSDFAIAEVTNDKYRILYRLPPLSQKALGNSFMPDDAIEYAPGRFAVAGGKLFFFDINTGSRPDTVEIPGVSAKIRGLRKVGNYLLVGTYGQGLYIYKDGIVKKMPLDKNGFLSTVHCFMLDGNGYCWISTNRGIFKVSVKALLAAYEHDFKEIYYHYFGKSDGIINTEFNGGCQPCALRLSNGKFSFPSMNGMVVFDPLQYHSGPPQRTLVVDQISADTSNWVPADSSFFTVPYHNKQLRFTISLPYFGDPGNVYFSYKLDSYHQQWQLQDLLQNNVLQFGQLPPGRYKLLLRVRNGYGPTDFQLKEMRFEVLTPWFQTWWFYAMLAVLLTGLIALVIKWRTSGIVKRKLELQHQVKIQTMHLDEQSMQLTSQLTELKAQQIRLKDDNIVKGRLIAIISHDIISPLKFIGYMSKKLQPVFPETDPNYQTVTFIANIAQDIESLSVNILNWIRFHHDSFKMVPEAFYVSQMISESVEIAKTLASEKGVDFMLEADETIRITQYRQAMAIILYNLIMNAIKYTEEGSIIVTASLEGKTMAFSVRDTGVGMHVELVDRLNNEEAFVSDYSAGVAKKYQFGYVLIKDLLRLSGGQLKVESIQGQGTTVWVQFDVQ